MGEKPFNATGTPDLFFVHDGKVELTSQDKSLGQFTNFYDLFDKFFEVSQKSIKFGM